MILCMEYINLLNIALAMARNNHYRDYDNHKIHGNVLGHKANTT